MNQITTEQLRNSIDPETGRLKSERKKAVLDWLKNRSPEEMLILNELVYWTCSEMSPGSPLK